MNDIVKTLTCPTYRSQFNNSVGYNKGQIIISANHQTLFLDYIIELSI